MKLVEGGHSTPRQSQQIALDDAWTNLSPEQKAATDKSTMAERILRLTAQGERDPIRLSRGAIAPG
jgi:hypothetical protein